MSPNLIQRLKMSSLAIPFLLLVIYFSTYPVFMPIFMCAITAIISLALWEYYQIAAAKGLQPLTWLGIGATWAYTIALFLKSQFPVAVLLPHIVLGIFLALSFGYALLKGSEPLVTLAITIFGLVYLTIPLSFLIFINYLFSNGDAQDGRWWLLYLLVTAKMTDTGAFAVGKLFGKTPLAPAISPRKTWEGALGGLIAGVATSVLFVIAVKTYFVHPPMNISIITSIWLGAILSLLAQFGDLAESLLKRDAGVKDSAQIPGLGGVLDIVDSLVFAAPFLYLFMEIAYR